MAAVLERGECLRLYYPDSLSTGESPHCVWENGRAPGGDSSLPHPGGRVGPTTRKSLWLDSMV